MNFYMRGSEILPRAQATNSDLVLEQVESKYRSPFIPLLMFHV